MPGPSRPLQINDAWLKITAAAKQLKISRSLSNGNKRLTSEAVAILKEPQKSTKRAKYQIFLHDVLLKCGPGGVLVCAVALGQNNVASMNKPNRAGLLQRLEKHEQALLQDATLQSLAAVYNIPKSVEDLYNAIHNEQCRLQEGSASTVNSRHFAPDTHFPQETHQEVGTPIGSRREAEAGMPRPISRGFVPPEPASVQRHILEGSEPRDLLQSQGAKNYTTSGAAIPLTVEAVDIILSHLKDGRGDGLTISFPPPQVHLPFITVPHHICADIIRIAIDTNRKDY